MSDKQHPEPNQTQLLEVQAALLNLRDGLMNLKLSLQALAFITDESVQRDAQLEADNLFVRLRG